MYTKDQFRRCSMNALEPNLFEEYPRLLEMLPRDTGEFSGDEHQEKMIRYVLALYDPRSPLIKDYPDLNTRKIAASEIAGYDLELDKAMLEEIIFNCGSTYLVEFIVTYLRQIVQSRAWASITADEQTYWEFISRMMLPVKADKDKDEVSAVSLKTKLGEDKEHIAERLDRNWNRFLGDDEELKKKVQKAKGWSPEEQAGVS